MRSDRILAITAGATAILLSGCAQAPLEMGKPVVMGEAMKQTFAAQVVDPLPAYDTAVPATSGVKTAEAIQRYRTDKVKQPDKVRTTATISGSSGQ